MSFVLLGASLIFDHLKKIDGNPETREGHKSFDFLHTVKSVASVSFVVKICFFLVCSLSALSSVR